MRQPGIGPDFSAWLHLAGFELGTYCRPTAKYEFTPKNTARGMDMSLPGFEDTRLGVVPKRNQKAKRKTSFFGPPLFLSYNTKGKRMPLNNRAQTRVVGSWETMRRAL